MKIDISLIKQTLDQFKTLGGEVVEFSGGEPMAHPNLLDAVKYSKRLGLKVDLFTSGYYVGFNFDPNLLPYLDRVFLNIQGPTAEIHDRLTGISGSFSKVIALGKYLVSNGIWVGTHLIPFSYNLEGLIEYLDLAKHYGFQNISLLRFVEQGRGREMESNLMLKDSEILTLHDIIHDCKSDPKIIFKHGCPLDFQFLYSDDYTVIPCQSGITRAVIKVNGHVLPCPAFKDTPLFEAGNIYESSLSTIWEDSTVFKIFRELDITKLKGRCNECRHVSLCRGRCPAQRFHHYGDIMMCPDPYCPLHLEEKISHN